VTVCGQRFLDALPLHEHEAHRVAEGVALVQALAEQVERLIVKGTIHPDDFYARMDEKSGRETQGGLAGNFSDLGKGNEFGQHITVREVTPFALEEALRLSVLGLVL